MLIENKELFISLITGFFLILFVAFVFILSIIRYKRKSIIHINEKQALKSQFQQELLKTQLEIQEETLKNISQEIHDNIGQVLTLAKLNLNTFENIEEKKLEETKTLVSKAINDLRDLTRSMHGERITELGLNEAIESELKVLSNIGHFKTSFSKLGTVYRLPPQKEMILFRILQESLHNIIKHAKATNINVTADYQAYYMCLEIEDDGVGFDQQTLQIAYKGIGLRSMQNRAALLDGECIIKSEFGKGTCVTIQLNNI